MPAINFLIADVPRCSTDPQISIDFEIRVLLKIIILAFGGIIKVIIVTLTLGASAES